MQESQANAILESTRNVIIFRRFSWELKKFNLQKIPFQQKIME